ncbi:MAG TPA: HAMP domain-containing sensor histidine kinase [Candidatus Limnocylindrales bacterium]|nr:HAMP domain-containing sensor histidine kinase [Candidatus Limnocylindrales bacterium]
MTDARPTRPARTVPTVDPPTPFVERRRRFRREADRLAHEETRLLARALDVLAADRSPEARLAGLLDLLAETVGAHRAAVVADGAERRVAVAGSGPDDETAAIALGEWLDAAAPRDRARRAAAAKAPVSVILRPDDVKRRPTGRTTTPFYACLPIPSAGSVALGFAFVERVTDAEIAARLPPAVARHAAVAMALATEALATERTLALLQASEAERGRFVSTVAHELRTPLTGLSGYLDLILDGRVGDAAVEREFLERGRTIVASMAGLVADLLELSKLESGTLALDVAPFSVADALGAVSASLLPLAIDRAVRIDTTAPPRMRAATGDRRRVEQILTNLAANALKFGADGGVIELAGRFEGSVAVLAVRDAGAGIEAEDRERIFERFYRLADHERVTGTGLGLPIARDLARAMGGELAVASLPGVGSTFILVLPGPAGATDATMIEAAMTAALEVEIDRLTTAEALRRAAGQRGTGSRSTEPAAALPRDAREPVGLRR